MLRTRRPGPLPSAPTRQEPSSQPTSRLLSHKVQPGRCRRGHLRPHRPPARGLSWSSSGRHWVPLTYAGAGPGRVAVPPPPLMQLKSHLLARLPPPAPCHLSPARGVSGLRTESPQGLLYGPPPSPSLCSCPRSASSPALPLRPSSKGTSWRPWGEGGRAGGSFLPHLPVLVPTAPVLSGDHRPFPSCVQVI